MTNKFNYNPYELKMFSRVLPDDLESQINDWLAEKGNKIKIHDISYYVKDKIYCFILYHEL